MPAVRGNQINIETRLTLGLLLGAAGRQHEEGDDTHHAQHGTHHDEGQDVTASLEEQPPDGGPHDVAHAVEGLQRGLVTGKKGRAQPGSTCKGWWAVEAP